jgi:hypothetical protein
VTEPADPERDALSASGVARPQAVELSRTTACRDPGYCTSMYAAGPAHALGRRVLALFTDEPAGDAVTPTGVGSMLLLPELLTKPTRDQADSELVALTALLARLDLRPLDEATAELAAALGATYGLRAADAIHLATAVGVGADRSSPNNHRDFPRRSPKSTSPIPIGFRSRTARQRPKRTIRRSIGPSR